MPSHAMASPLSAFDTLQRGDTAPSWLASNVIEAWKLDPAHTVITLIAVSENATFRVVVNGEPHAVLRVHRPGHVGDDRQIIGELTWMEQISHATSVAVPNVLSTAAGQLVHTINLDDSRWFCVVFEFVGGEVLEDLTDPRPYYEEIGAITARLHNHVQRWTPPAGFARFSWTINDMLGDTSRWGDWRAAELDSEQRTILEHAEQAALARLRDLEEGGDDWGLVHADLRPSNIMIDGDRLTVIDFDDCGYSWLLYDFAAALSFIEHESYARELAHRWVAGYRTVRTLDESQLEVANALSMIRRLTMLGWTTTHRADALPPALWAAQVPGTLAVARSYLESPRWLFDSPTQHIS